LSWTNDLSESVRSLNMPAYVGGTFRMPGTKIINSNVANPLRGYSRASGLTLLFDTRTARVRCVAEGAFISALRTAAVSTLAINMLAATPLRTLTIVGAGVIGSAHAKLAASRFSALQRIVLFDSNVEAASTLHRSLSDTLPSRIQIQVAADAESATRTGDAVITATTVTEGYIHLAWLKPGAVIVNTSLDDLMPEVFLNADLLFVDDWTLICNDSRRLLGKLHRKGLIVGSKEAPPNGARRIDGSLSDLILKRHLGRQRGEQIVVVNPFGLAIEDVAIAARVYQLALQNGVGTYLPL
jgi:ornithine cyclodeaminase/alanine dehydrogenase-like protein (mu-crystallin family)